MKKQIEFKFPVDNYNELLNKEDRMKKLQFPFNKSDSIDFLTENASDHDYLEKNGYELVFNADSSYSVKELPGLSPSSYGNWGTLYKLFASKNAVDVFLDMVDKGIVKIWRTHHNGKLYEIVNGRLSVYEM